jgi:hypothetical protein
MSIEKSIIVLCVMLMPCSERAGPANDLAVPRYPRVNAPSPYQLHGRLAASCTLVMAHVTLPGSIIGVGERQHIQ